MGLQIFAEMGEEQGEHPGLGWIPGRVKSIPTALPLPHVGWNAVQQCQTSPLFHAIPQQSCFYFTHSYSLQGAPNEQVLAQTDYGGNLVAAIGIGRRYAVQFHPEKSQAVGLQLLRNFLELC